MVRIRADSVAVDPAAFAFFSCRRSDDDFHVAVVFTGNGFGRGFAFDQFGFADDEQRGQLILQRLEPVPVERVGL